MGDRRNVVVEFENDLSVVFYTHWSGSDLPETLANALKRGTSRWSDPSYLARIIFSEMVKDSILDPTGYGIEPIVSGSDEYTEADPGYDLVVDLKDQTVSVLDDETGRVQIFEFPEFVSLYV